MDFRNPASKQTNKCHWKEPLYWSNKEEVTKCIPFSEKSYVNEFSLNLADVITVLSF